MKIISYYTLILTLITSCELFGSSDSDDDIKGGEVVWRLENQTERLVSTQPLIENGRVYFLQDGYLKAYTMEEGNYIWSTQIAQQSAGDYSRKIISNNEMLFLDQGYNIKAFSKNNGSVLWNTRITDDGQEVAGIGSPIMSQDETYLYAGRRGYIVKVRKSDGQIAGHYPLDRLVPEDVTQGSTEPIISPFGDDILYVPASYYDRTTPGEEEFGGNMFAFNANTGEMLWEKHVEYTIADLNNETSNDSLQVSPPIYDIEITESHIIILQGFFISVLDRSNGQMKWFNFFPESGFDVGLAVQVNGVYAASVGSFAHKLDLHTGEELWRRDIRFSNTSIPTVQNGRLYFNNSGGGGIWVLDTHDGSVIYNQNTPNYRHDNFDVYISSLGVGEGYMVNVGSKAVYCLKVP
jgi:outer membrane protein assembly factor BamB